MVRSASKGHDRIGLNSKLRKYFSPRPKHLKRDAFALDHFLLRSRFYPRSRYQGAKCKRIGLDFLAGLFSDPVKICRYTCIRHMHKEMGKLMKHHKELFLCWQLAVD